MGSEAEQKKQKEEMDKLAMELVNKEILDLLPKTKTAKKYCYELNRNMLNFEVSMQRGSEDNATPTVKVRVNKSDTKEVILIEAFEFTKAASTLQDEHTRLKLTLENDREYTSPEARSYSSLHGPHHHIRICHHLPRVPAIPDGHRRRRAVCCHQKCHGAGPKCRQAGADVDSVGWTGIGNYRGGSGGFQRLK